MKKMIFFLVTGIVMLSMLSSCAATKRDCQGVKHYKQKGGFYM
jgi:hypothetical protein